MKNKSLQTDKCIVDIFAKYSKMVYRLCFVYLRNRTDADDAFQEIFIKYFTSSPVFIDEIHEKAWMMKVSANHCKNFLKSTWNTKTVAIDDDLAVISDESDREVIKQVMTLPEKYRTVIHLYYFEGYSTVEIAAMLHKNGATVRTILKRGREMLRELLKGEIDFEEPNI